jgi:PKHD-type hydroxylase
MIYNDPWERHIVTYPYIWQDGAFSDDELQTIVNYCDAASVEKGTTFSGIDETIRKSGVKFHHRNDHTAWIFDRLNFYIEALNEKYYQFDLNGYDSFQYTTYDKSGKYGWHMDTMMDKGNNQLTRKLSLTLLLNDDFTGGDFMINLGNEKKASAIEMKKGRMILFPSFMIHQVTPIKKGTRKSLVVWTVGPKFK